MKLLVFGANGLTGREIVKCALDRGHDVTAFVRSKGELSSQDDRLRIVRGDITDGEAVAAEVEGQDAVVSALGGKSPWQRSPAIVEGVRNIVRAMQRHGVDRLIYQSALGVGDSLGDAHALVRWLIIPLVLKNSYADHELDEATIRASGLRWTIVRPTKLTNGQASGNYRSGPHLKDAFPIGLLPRADVAAFIVQVLAEEHTVRQATNLVR